MTAPRPAMLEPFDAVERIISAVAPLEEMEVPLEQADGHVLSRDVVSGISMPLWANSAMDGYACRSFDVADATPESPVPLDVIESVAAGAFPTLPVMRGQAIRIATGAPIPDDADTVIRVEDTDGGMVKVLIRDSRDTGRNVRPAGEDIRSGQIAVAASTVAGPAQIALLATVGAARVHVHRRPRVGIIATGDELVSLGQFAEVEAGRRIVSSNSYGLIAAVRAAGGEPVDFGIIADDASAIRSVLERASSTCDLIITSAGVSVGEADHLKRIVAELGGSITFWRVRMRPGSPLAFGSIRGVPWLGLPGNPVSTLVTFELFARAVIRRMLGDTRRRDPISVLAGEAFTVGGNVTHFLRVRLETGEDGLPRAYSTGPQASNILSSLARADALLIIPPDAGTVSPGTRLRALPLG